MALPVSWVVFDTSKAGLTGHNGPRTAAADGVSRALRGRCETVSEGSVAVRPQHPSNRLPALPQLIRLANNRAGARKAAQGSGQPASVGAVGSQCAKR